MISTIIHVPDIDLAWYVATERKWQIQQVKVDDQFQVMISTDQVPSVPHLLATFWTDYVAAIEIEEEAYGS